MRGTIKGEELRLSVTLTTQDGKKKVVDCVVDTGFQGALVLPTELVVEMGWPILQKTESFLADGSRCTSNAHRVGIHWHGKLIEVAALAMGDRPLVGTALLMGNDIHIRFEEGGWFELTPLA